jgi:hypothetical protein
MSGATKGQVAVRRRRGSKRYGLRFAVAGKRRYLALGCEREGWSPGLAERVLIALGGGFLAGDPNRAEASRCRERSGG